MRIPSSKDTGVHDTVQAGSDPKYTVGQLAEMIKRMELELGLLTDERYGYEARVAWEATRFKVHTELKGRFSGTRVAHTAAAPHRRLNVPALVRHAARLFFNATLRSWVFAPRGRDFLVLPHPRRRLTDNGLYEDIYTDELISQLGAHRVAIIEKPLRWRHESPRPHRVWHNELNLILAWVGRRLKPRRPRRSVLRMASDVDAWLYTNIGDPVGVGNEITRSARAIPRNEWAYGAMLRWLKPKALLLLVSYDWEPAILAAKKRGIPTIELQHGVITSQHLGYAVPSGHRMHSFPDYIWLFGQYWRDTVEYPLASKHVQILGYPYFERLRHRLSALPGQRQIVFISQGSIGALLSHFAAEFSRFVGDNARVVYKLHPTEWNRWRKEYPWLVSASADGRISVVEGMVPELYELLAQSLVQVGVHSTALFEGLGLGCRTILVDLPGVEYMQPLIDRGLAQVISNWDELNVDSLFGNSPAAADAAIASELFYPHWREQLSRLSDEVLASRISR